MQTPPVDLLERALQFLKALEAGETGDALSAYYAPDALQTEFPNLLTRNLTERDFMALKTASEKGRQVMTRQTFEVVHAHVSGTTVIIEAIWTGVLAVPLGRLPVGGEMRAYFAQFFEFQGDKIIRQRNYDCFEPFL